MRLSQKYFRVRLALLIATLMTLFLSFLNYGLIKDYLTVKEGILSETFIIDSLYFNSWIEKRTLKSDISRTCFDIRIKDKPYFIRLSDNSHSDKWIEIKEKFSSGDTLDILYKKRLLQDTILYNPDELKINKNTIISFTDRKKINAYAILGITGMTLVFGFVSFIAYKTYKKELLHSDKLLYRTSKWKLIGRWFDD